MLFKYERHCCVGLILFLMSKLFPLGKGERKAMLMKWFTFHDKLMPVAVLEGKIAKEQLLCYFPRMSSKKFPKVKHIKKM